MKINATNTVFAPITLVLATFAEAAAVASGLQDAGFRNYAKTIADAAGLNAVDTPPTETAAAPTTQAAADTPAPVAGPVHPFAVGDTVRVTRGQRRMIEQGDEYTVAEVLHVGQVVDRRSGPHTLVKPAIRLDRSEVNYRDNVAWDADRFEIAD